MGWTNVSYMSTTTTAEKTPGRLTDLQDIKIYVLAGRGRFTLRSTVTGERITYRVVKSEPKANNRNRPVWWVRFKAGPDDQDDLYLGTIIGGIFKLTFKSQAGTDSIAYKAFNYLWSCILKNELDDRLEFWHEGVCGMCGRTLTVPESIARGIGPECYKRIGR